MRKGIAAALVAVTVGGSMIAAAAPAAAQSRYYNGGRYDNYNRRGNDGSTAIIAGIAGLAIGAALASSSHSNSGYYNNGYYAPQTRYGSGYGYGSSYAAPYGSAYGYSSPYRTCEARERVYDPYMGRYVTTTRRYAC